MGLSILDLPQRRSVAETRAFHTIRLLFGFPFVDSSKSFPTNCYLCILLNQVIDVSKYLSKYLPFLRERFPLLTVRLAEAVMGELSLM